VFGCTLPKAEADRFFNTASRAQLYARGDEPIVANSGDKDFDYALAQMLAKISETFNVLPGFAFYDDGKSWNAYATREVRFKNSDGTVLFGLTYLRGLMSSADHPDVCVASVCAHEFGHILQYKRGLDEKLKQGQCTVKRVELQADFFAGYFAGRRKLERSTFPAEEFAMTQYFFGDDEIKHPDHHGTPDERGAAIVRGFEVAFKQRKSLDEAVQVGTNYVMSI